MNNMNIVFLPDLHIGHPQIPPERFYQNLTRYIYPKIYCSDMVIFGGDFFDELMNLNGAGGRCAVQVVHDIHYFIYKKDIQVRVLQGTAAHDRRQLKLFQLKHRHIAELEREEDPLIVYDKMQLEFNKRHNAVILYKPDDLPYNDALDRARKLLRDNNVDKADILVNHGYCRHLIPERAAIDKTNVYSAEELREICSGIVLNGHVHQPSVYDNFIISGGSFERFVHGEEHPKGFYVINHQEGEFQTEFVRNEGATPFITVDTISCGEDADSAISKVRTEVDKYLSTIESGRGMHVRVVTDVAEVKQALSKDLKTNYPQVTVKFQRSGQSLKEEDKLSQVELDLPSVTPENLPNLLHEKLKEELSLEEIQSFLTQKPETQY